MDDVPALVFDNGSSLIRAGFAEDDRPIVTLPTVVGRPKYNGPLPRHSGPKDTYVGDEAQVRRATHAIRNPIENGIVLNWDDMEKIWCHTFREKLGVTPGDHPVLLTEAAGNPPANREKMAEVMFEKFDLKACYIADQVILPLYASGRTTGVVLSLGEGVSTVAPIEDGSAVPNSMSRFDFAGKDLTVYLQRLLMLHCLERSYAYEAIADLENVTDLKEKMCYVAFEPKKYKRKAAPGKEHKLPDGNVIQAGNELFTCPEALFQPDFCGQTHVGIHQALYKSVMTCDADIRKELFANIVLSGGTTMLPGFAERMEKEVSQMAGRSTTVRIVAPPERTNSTWVGGSILASLSTFQNMWITKQQYEEAGPVIVHSKRL